MPGTIPLPPVNHPHGGPPWLLLLLLLLHTPPPLRVYPPPHSSRPQPSNLLCCLRFIINPSFCPSYSLLLSVLACAYIGQPLDTSGLSWGPRETGAGILNSKYLSRRRGAGRHSDKRVERVQARMGRLGWESPRSGCERYSLNAQSRKSSHHFYSYVCDWKFHT